MRRFIPSVLTLSGLFCGWFSLYFLVYSKDLETSFILICGASLLDILDGIVARKLGAVSVIGAQLDSLVDLFNFGVVPSVFVYQISLMAFGIYGWSIAGIFVICTSVRLARFNARSILGQSSNVLYFSGLPAALGAVLIYMLHFGIIPSVMIPFFAILISALMVSNIRFYSLSKFILQLKAKWTILVILSLLVIFSVIVFYFGIVNGLMVIILMHVAFAMVYPLLTNFRS